jgi:hypothetical protein
MGDETGSTAVAGFSRTLPARRNIRPIDPWPDVPEGVAAKKTVRVRSTGPGIIRDAVHRAVDFTGPPR